MGIVCSRFVAVFLFLLLLSSANAAPLNDPFASPEPVDEGSWFGTNVNATSEPGEPQHAGVPVGASVWFQWTAAMDGFLTVDTLTSTFDTVLAMYTGTALDALTLVAANDDAVGRQSRLSGIAVTAGTVYQIVVDGYFGSEGDIALTLSFFDGTDVTPPSISIAEPTEGALFVENALVAVSYSCADEFLGSGVASCLGDVATGNLLATNVQGSNTFTVTATDVAGNVANASVNYTISGTDVTPPVVNIASPIDGAVLTQEATILAAYVCSDEALGTGLASCVGDAPAGSPINTNTLGAKAFSVSGTDNAGNVTTEVANYTVIEALPNDQFSNAQLLPESGTLSSTNVGATLETSEPAHGFNVGGASVWFAWTPSFSGYVTVDTFGSDFDTTLGLYSGVSVSALTTIAQNNNSGGFQSRIAAVPVTAGTDYFIAVDGWEGATGAIMLTWSLSEEFDTIPPTITLWSPDNGEVVPQGEPLFAGYSCFDPAPGSGMESCIGNVPSNTMIDTTTPGNFVFTVTGTDLSGNVSVVTADYTIVANPPNDDFDSPSILAASGSITGTNSGATTEPGEPNHLGISGASVWFQWTATENGFLTVDTVGSNFDTALAMYSGTAVNALTELASNDDTVGFTSRLQGVPVVAGETYSIVVTGRWNATGQYVLTWSSDGLNDQTSPVVTLSAPAHSAVYFEGVNVTVDYECADETLGSGVGSCLGDQPTASQLDTSVPGEYTFTVTVTDNAGNSSTTSATYTIAARTNDNFASAFPITDRGRLQGTNTGATKEPGEPDHAGDSGGASVWFRYTAVEDGLLTVETIPSTFDTTLAVYTGSAVDDLTELGSDNDTLFSNSRVDDIAVTAGNDYFIAVDGEGAATGQINLHWFVFTGPSFVEVTPVADPLWVTPEDFDFWLNAATPADVDGDGDLDLAALGFFVEYNVGTETRLVVFVNDGADVDGNWRFTTQDIPLDGVASGASDMAFGDYDADGDADLVVASAGETRVFNNDGGQFTSIGNSFPNYAERSGYTGAYNLRSLSWADYDNDADLDLLMPSVYDSATSAYRTVLMRNDGSDGQGGWIFTETSVLLDGTQHGQTIWADNDGDGDLDLFMANIDNNDSNGFVRIFENDAGTFNVERPLAELSINYGLADWSDYDSDGDLDILIVGLIEDNDGLTRRMLRVYENEAGAYVPRYIILPNAFPWLDLHAATWADYDSDGDVDILATGRVFVQGDMAGASEVFVNEGGVFTPLGKELPAPIGSAGRGGSFTWFDVDGDGDLDYFVAGAYPASPGNSLLAAQMHLYRNDAEELNVAPEAPAALRATVTGDAVELAWDPTTDDTTSAEAITYELDVYASGWAIGAAGARPPRSGNVSAATSWLLKDLPGGEYTWSLQAVDSAFNGSVATLGSFTIGTQTDSDGDGITDDADNCQLIENADQRDTNADGYGNACDPDLNNDGVVNVVDLGLLRLVFFTDDADGDFNGDGVINVIDLGTLRSFFFMPPGPSGVAP